MMSQLGYGTGRGRTRAIAKSWLGVVGAALVTLSALHGARAANDLSDTPMFARVQPPPANIMFLLDDSGSMNFEILVTGQYDGSFPNPAQSAADLANDPHGFCYVFDDVGDNVYKSPNYPNRYAGSEGRKYWKSQWYETNVMFYNPNITYRPWPSYGNTTFPDANPDKPRSHPVNHSSDTLTMQGTSFTVGAAKVPHSHYFVFSATRAKPYLVVIDTSSIKYYEATVSGYGLAEKITKLTLDSNPPADVKSARMYVDDKQNFANWFTYFRRREFVAKNALANVIKSLSQVRVGIYGINKKLVQPLADVQVTHELTVSDSTDTLLGLLYPYTSDGNTPLKAGLKTIGNYFSTNDGKLETKTGPKPYGTAIDGAACQQSFTIILTDGYYDDLDTTLDGNTDGDNGPPYADSHSNTLADIAMYYYENDLAPGLADQVPMNKYDRATHQHMSTYAVAFGVSGTLDPADYDADFRHNGKLIQWTVPSAPRQSEAVDDLWHATVNGRGKFFNASNPVALTSALNELMNAIAEILIGSSSAVTVNGDYLYGKVGSDTIIYQGLYSNRDGEWTGDVKAYPVDAVTGEVLVNTPRWSAAAMLDAKTADQRLIATYDGTAAGIPFQDSKPDRFSKNRSRHEPGQSRGKGDVPAGRGGQRLPLTLAETGRHRELRAGVFGWRDLRRCQRRHAARLRRRHGRGNLCLRAEPGLGQPQAPDRTGLHPPFLRRPQPHREEGRGPIRRLARRTRCSWAD